MTAAKHTPMVVAAARALNKRCADACGIDAEDQWKIYGAEFLEDAQFVLDAAGASDLLASLKEADEDFEREGFDKECSYRDHIIAAIDKATGGAA